MRFRQVFWAIALLLLAAAMTTACSGPPPMRHPEMHKAAESFRPLSSVPARPEVRVPLNDRTALEEELRDNNLQARRARAAQGYAEPTLPTEEPEIPMQIPEEE